LSAVFVDNLQKKLRRRLREEPQPASPGMPQFVEMFESLRWTLVAMYLYIVGGIWLLLVFHVHIHRPLPHELREAVRRAPCIFAPSEFSLSRNVSEDIFHLCNL
jgi:hypothetical protein